MMARWLRCIGETIGGPFSTANCGVMFVGPHHDSFYNDLNVSVRASHCEPLIWTTVTRRSLVQGQRAELHFCHSEIFIDNDPS